MASIQRTVPSMPESSSEAAAPSNAPSIGSIVRAKRPRSSDGQQKEQQRYGQAQVLTIDGGTKCSLLWSCDVYETISTNDNVEFVQNIIPWPPLEDEEQDDVLLSDVEIVSDPSSSSFSIAKGDVSLETAKKEGDALLRSKDFVGALWWYHRGLLLCSDDVSIGGRVLVNVAGHPTMADVDCIENDSLDITYADKEFGDEVEKTVPRSSILLPVSSENADHLQERVLLNVARCHFLLGLHHQPCVLACSLALALLLDDKESDTAALQQTARTVRAKAYLSMGKLSHAKADVKRLTTNEKSTLLRQIEVREKVVARANKSLVKNMSAWVDRAMFQNSGDFT